MTLVALCTGLTSIRMSIEHKFELAVALIAVAAALDGIDGRMARFLKSTSRFGAELDSITDFLNFGVAPVILLYVWALGELRSVGWMAALIFTICAALRLARFNVALDAPDKPDWHASFFVGVPAPAGAMIVMLPIYVEFVAIPHGFLTAPAVFVYTIAVGLLMVSKLPTWSGKLIGRRISRELVTPLFVSAMRDRRLPRQLSVGDDDGADALLSRLPAAVMALLSASSARRERGERRRGGGRRGRGRRGKRR